MISPVGEVRGESLQGSVCDHGVGTEAGEEDVVVHSVECHALIILFILINYSVI